MGKSSKNNHSTSDSDSSSSSISSSDSEKCRKKLKKLKKKLKREEKKKLKRLKKKLKSEKKKHKKDKKTKQKPEKVKPKNENQEETVTPEKTSNVPVKLMEMSKAMAPMTKDEWEKKQSVVRRVLDEESGRYRLIKGDGEVLEEIVSLKRHKEINKQATLADGAFFQSQTVKK